MQLSANPEEVLDVVREMYPREFDRAVAELTIRKQAELIERLSKENESLKSSVVDTAAEERHTHPHEH